MARMATTADAFNAVAEERRRQILDLLRDGERSVSELVQALGVAQPVVSKHLRVLREVGLVAVRDAGRQRMYQLDPRPLEAIFDWVRSYERAWSQRFEALDAVLEELKAAEVLKEVGTHEQERDRDAPGGQPDPGHQGG